MKNILTFNKEINTNFQIIDAVKISFSYCMVEFNSHSWVSQAGEERPQQ